MAVTTNLEKFLKSRFPQKEVYDCAIAPTQFLNAVKKADVLEGDYTYVPIKTESAGGTAGTLGVAQAAAAADVATGARYTSVASRWQIPRTTLYTVVRVPGEDIHASRSNKGAFIRLLETEIESGLLSHGQVLAHQAWGDGVGDGTYILGQVASVSGEILTLTQASDAYKFHVGQSISGRATAGGAIVVSSYVTAVDYDAGTVTVEDAEQGGGADFHATSAEFITTTNATTAMMGVSSFIPLSAPSATSFLGVDRTSNVNALAGHRQSWLGSIEETVKKLDAKMRRRNTKSAMACWLSFNNMHRLEMELQGRAYREDGTEKGALFGLPGLVLNSPGGRIKFMADSFMLEDRGFLLDMNSWEMMHLEGLPHIVQDDNNRLLRVADADSVETRIRSWAHLVCKEPILNGTFNVG